MGHKENKITFKMIYIDFKKRYPRLAKMVIHWQPHSYATIYVKLKNGMELTYDIDTERATILSI